VAIQRALEIIEPEVAAAAKVVPLWHDLPAPSSKPERRKKFRTGKTLPADLGPTSPAM
jgi:hypothetical protein